MSTLSRLRPAAAVRWLVYLIADAISPKPQPPRGCEPVYISQLKADVSALSLPNSDGTTINDDWVQNLATLRHHILNDDPTEFLRWQVILRTMFVGLRPYVLRELHFLRKHDWPRWRRAIRESTVGHPYRFPLYPASSANLIHYAHHLANFEATTGMKITDLDFILEFGGGYGGMSRVIRNLGFERQYAIFDLSLFSALQRYFLQMNGLPVTQIPAAATARDVLCISDLQSLQATLSGLPKHGKFMLIATWSLSEAPLELRNSFLNMTQKFGFFLIGYQDSFAGVDNRKFFADWAASRERVSWSFRAIPHLPGSYLIGGSRNPVE